MGDRPWRCSNCGTINEPGTDSCRNCGKWPSLFDLEDDVMEEEDFEPIPEPEPVATYEAQAPEAQPRTVEVETFEVPEPVPTSQPTEPEPAPVEPKADEDEESRGPRWVRWLVPIVFVAYLAVSYFFQNR